VFPGVTISYFPKIVFFFISFYYLLVPPVVAVSWGTQQ
jgi:hypothetical protein